MLIFVNRQRDEEGKLIMPNQRWLDAAERVLPCNCDAVQGFGANYPHADRCQTHRIPAVAQLAQEAFEAGKLERYRDAVQTARGQ